MAQSVFSVASFCSECWFSSQETTGPSTGNGSSAKCPSLFPCVSDIEEFLLSGATFWGRLSRSGSRQPREAHSETQQRQCGLPRGAHPEGSKSLSQPMILQARYRETISACLNDSLGKHTTTKQRLPWGLGLVSKKDASRGFRNILEHHTCTLPTPT